MSKFKVTMDRYKNKLVSTIETKLLCVSSSNLADMLTGHRSKLKIMIGIIDKCGVRGDATLCVVIFIFGSILKSNFRRILTSF